MEAILTVTTDLKKLGKTAVTDGASKEQGLRERCSMGSTGLFMLLRPWHWICVGVCLGEQTAANG